MVNSYISTFPPPVHINASSKREIQDDLPSPTFTEIPNKFTEWQDKLSVSGVQWHLAHSHHSAAQGKWNKEQSQREGGFTWRKLGRIRKGWTVTVRRVNPSSCGQIYEYLVVGKVSAQPRSYSHPPPSPCGLVPQALPTPSARHSQDFTVFRTGQSAKLCRTETRSILIKRKIFLLLS